MRTIERIRVIESINDFLHDSKLSEQFYNYSAEKDSDFINEPERAARCHDSAEFGADGKLHCEAIDDFREFGRALLAESWKEIDNRLTYGQSAHFNFVLTKFLACEKAFEADCAACEQWYIDNGSYEQQIG